MSRPLEEKARTSAAALEAYLRRADLVEETS